MPCCHSKKGNLSIELPMSETERGEDANGDTQASSKDRIDGCKGKGKGKLLRCCSPPFKGYQNGPIFSGARTMRELSAGAGLKSRVSRGRIRPGI